MKPLRGIIPPVPTPFTRSGELDTDTLRGLLGGLEPSVDGFLLLGSNGEAVYLTEHERDEVVRTAREVIPDSKPLIVGTGGEATQIVADRNRRAADLGADYVLVLPPHYFKGQMTDDVLATHYRYLADDSAVPVLLYNMPAATTLSLSPNLVATLAAHANIVGLKDSSGNVPAMVEILRQVPTDFTVLTGNAPTLLASLALGAKGGILAVANVAPKAYRQIFDAAAQGDITTARELQKQYNPLALAVTARYGVPGLKAVLREQGLSAGYPRAPMLDVDGGVAAELKRLIEETFAAA
ncbi:MAG: dihydrodipicolinate synthase family protein [Trueperaceae bacterium]|nr:dihydrodipicolinate synthase family protein [Trueperaceae bacterium]